MTDNKNSTHKPMAADSEYRQLPLVAIVILNWNGKKFLEKFLPSVLSSTYVNKRIIVADNASTDDSVIFVQQNFPEVEIIQNNSNAGFAAGYNLALQKVQSDYYVLLNSDVEVSAGWIEPIIRLMESDDRIGACQPKVLAYNDKKTFEYAGACGGWIDRFGYPFSRGRVFDYCEPDHHQYDEPVQCFWASGCSMFVRSAVYHEMGGLDAYFFAHQEEIDLCWRMQLSGYKVFVQPLSVVYHVGGGTLPKGNSLKTYLNYRNNLIMIYKNLKGINLFLTIKSRLVLDIIAAWKYLFSGDLGYFMAIAKAHLHFMRWFFFHQSKSIFPKKNLPITHGKYKGAVVWDYFISKKRKFSEIVTNK